MKTSKPLPKKEQLLKKIGVSFGITVNMGDFESARIDCWEDDYVSITETSNGTKKVVVKPVQATAVVSKEEKDAKYEYLWNSVNHQVRKQLDRVFNASDGTPDKPKRNKQRRRG